MAPGPGAYAETLYQSNLSATENPLLTMLMDNVRNNLQRAMMAALDAEKHAFHVTNMLGFVRWKTDLIKHTFGNEDKETATSAGGGSDALTTKAAGLGAAGALLVVAVPGTEAMARGDENAGRRRSREGRGSGRRLCRDDRAQFCGNVDGGGGGFLEIFPREDDENEGPEGFLLL
mmetsp:Transcript_8556/g.20765  ORF Transcript_8556/g.20765 Transcript_8556/m.20765 type:complete len:175 (-) Transcript_8556:22-546(-)